MLHDYACVTLSCVVGGADTVQKSGEFAHAYEQLCGARNAYDRARHKYERSARLLEDARAMHREATAQLGQLKDQFIEVQCALRCRIA